MPLSETLFLAGRILKPRGLKGDLKVLPETDFPERFLERKRLYVGRSPEHAVEYNVVHASLQKGFVYIRLQGALDRDTAESLAGSNLYVQESELAELPSDMAWIHELVGLKACDTDGKEVGIVRDVLDMPAHQVYEIEMSDGKRVLVPALEEFVEETDVTGGRIVLKRFDEFTD